MAEGCKSEVKKLMTVFTGSSSFGEPANMKNPRAAQGKCNHEWGDGHTPDGKTHWEACVKCNKKKEE